MQYRQLLTGPRMRGEMSIAIFLCAAPLQESPETILVALEAGQAQRTASASLSTPLGIVVTGDS